MNTAQSKKSLILLVGVFIVAFIFGPIRQHHGLDLIPGDFGDARLNNYFLENIHQFLIGNSPSLIHLNFFSFFPFVLGFGDNLFGASPIYLLFRALEGEPDTAFQIWFYCSYIANYFSAYWGLRLLGIKPMAAIFGALIFTFTIPISAKTLHVQLSYRFCVPLVLAYFYLFLSSGNIRLLLYSMAWLVWGFYCSIYIGAFTTLFIGLMALLFMAIALYRRTFHFSKYMINWKALSLRTYMITSFSACGMLGAMLILLFPYIEASYLYGFKRSYSEIASLLPTFKSYFLADLSPIWGNISALYNGISSRHEQQLFIGIFPLVLLIGSLFLIKQKQQTAYWVMGGTILLIFIFTLKIGGQHSIWELFSKLPLLNSLRAMGRIILVILFPIAFLCSLTVQYLIDKKNKFINILLIMLFLGTLIEATSSKVYVAFPKEEWRLRLDRAEKRLPKDLSSDAILFFSQLTQAPHIDELDAMWVAMKYAKPTLNGYSGNFPPGYQYDFGSNCTELPKRIMAYLYFTKQLNGNQYEKLMQRVVPVGFEHCNFAKFGLHPKLSSAEKSYSAEVFKKLHIRVDGVEALGTRWRVKINLENDGDQLFSAYSRSGNPIAISYRFLDANERPITDWNPRVYLWADIPAHDSLYLEFEAPNQTNSNFLELSIVQEGIFWSHDLGLVPKKVALQSFGSKN